MASTFLVRLKIGSILVDAKGVSKLYNQKLKPSYMIGLFAAAMVLHYSNLNHVSSHKTCNKTAGTSLKNAFTLNETSFRGS